jgi:hypothetical protein
MELQKISKRFENLQNTLEKAYKKDIKEIIQKVFTEYDICYKNTSESVEMDTFINHFLFNSKEEIPICMGISKNGNKCCRKPQSNSNYCKIHFYLHFNQKTHVENHIYIIDEHKEIKKDDKLEKDLKNLEKIFIEDTFYYKDNEFLYDINNFQKVGYIENDQPILTDDPFILGI